MTMNQWWYQEMGERIGPFSESQMRAMVARGIVDAHTPVFCSTRDGWRSAAAAGLVDTSTAWPVARPQSMPVVSPGINGVGPVTKVRVLRGGGGDGAAAPPKPRPAREPAAWSLLLSLVCCVGALSAWAPWVKVPIVGEMNGFAFSTTWPAWLIVGGFSCAAVASWVCRGWPLIACVGLPVVCSCYAAGWMMDRVAAVLARHGATEAGRRAIEATGSGESWGLTMAILCGVAAVLGSIWCSMAND